MKFATTNSAKTYHIEALLKKTFDKGTLDKKKLHNVPMSLGFANNACVLVEPALTKCSVALGSQPT